VALPPSLHPWPVLLALLATPILITLGVRALGSGHPKVLLAFLLLLALLVAAAVFLG
jgi:hypothetical protein